MTAEKGQDHAMADQEYEAVKEIAKKGLFQRMRGSADRMIYTDRDAALRGSCFMVTSFSDPVRS
ncbi:MAG TPA: hypothetical protein HA298_04185 [Methanobacteriales archaeon]|jgi:hypothetical protein|nr:hypothetical protein [Methanobacteriales archaeon]